MMTSVEDAKRFVSESGIDVCAGSGNIHGMVGVAKDRHSLYAVKEIANAVGIPLVLTALRATPRPILWRALKQRCCVHINTELRVLYRDSLRESLKGDETTPYKFLTPSVDAMKSF